MNLVACTGVKGVHSRTGMPDYEARCAPTGAARRTTVGMGSVTSLDVTPAECYRREIAPWLEYHTLLGVDHFVVYANELPESLANLQQALSA
jgi:hypothetical protein